MSRIDLLKIRKATGISQKELAEKLAVRPSFLSAIENGRSRFPDEKIERLKEILLIGDLTPYTIEEEAEHSADVVPPHTHTSDETDAIANLLKHIHAQAHKEDDSAKNREMELRARIEYLTERADRQTERIEALLVKLETLLNENMRLKNLLLSNHIEF